ncbi:gamma-secretase subunit Aph-1-like [Acanthaster planci]|uniref:Gamma-secretase subunit Aph-1-like n=1 Tax=Acanthaster planci TaxID=133434 RepID=A0A8B7ZZ25_ACAPL|nr:gamma-secretase subunit Aph-1-like [Acanthaster planci]XP_022110353.1 gamma-secretase subunit Aph-1-like [Acanthaster planci]
MTLMQLFGALFIAYGPPACLFIITIARNPLRVIVMIAGMFFWLVSLLFSSIWWFAVVPLRDQLAFGLTFSVLFQELMRLGYYKLLRKAEDGLQQFNQTGPPDPRSAPNANGTTSDSARHVYAYVAGLGFGLMSGVLQLVNVIADSRGPGTVGIDGGPSNFLITSAFLTMAFVLLHIVWNVLFFWGCETKKYYVNAIVVFSHFLVSELTLLNQEQLYTVTLPVAYAILLVQTAWAFIVVGGSVSSLRNAFKWKAQRYAL